MGRVQQSTIQHDARHTLRYSGSRSGVTAYGSGYNVSTDQRERCKEARTIADCVQQGCEPWKNAWNEVERYILPRMEHEDTATTEEGIRVSPHRGQRIIDASATRAVRILAAGMHGGLTSPARPWFRLRLDDDDATESGPERRWLDVVERRMYTALARSNFYQVAHSLYTELAAFGSADIYQEMDDKRLMRFSCLNCGDFAWACDAAGRIDTVVRRASMTARQLAQRYSVMSLSERVQRMLRRNPEEQVDIIHMVRPRQDFDPHRMGQQYMPWESLTWEANGGEGFLQEGGYEEFPHLTARWDIVGNEIYGRSPGMDVLPDVKMLQEMARSQLLAIHKVVNPPMRVPSTFKQRLNLIPGGQNYVAAGHGDGIAPLYQINPDIGSVTRKIEDVRRAIREGFFNDLFLLFTSEGRSNITATEVAERGEEKLLMLGPVIERHQTELLDPLLERTYGILKRSGMLPPAPPALEGRTMRVEYVSTLAQAQRAVTAQAIRGFASDVAALAKFSPEILDKIDFEQAVDELASIAGVPAKIVRSDTEVTTLRLARAQAEGDSTGVVLDSAKVLLEQLVAPNVSDSGGADVSRALSAGSASSAVSAL